MANKKSSKLRKFIIFALILLVLGGLGAVAIFKKHETVIRVETEKVTRRNLTETVVANGRIQPVTQVIISPEVAGEIVALPVEEGDHVKKGDLLVQIKPDSYQANRNSAEAQYQSALVSRNLARAELEKAGAEFRRYEDLFQNKLVSDSVFLDYKTAYDVAKLRGESAQHQVDQARFGLDKATDDLSKTTITSPIDGTVARLRSQLGERVLGTSFNMGTEIMTIADLGEMEARVDIGEMDVVLIEPGQNARLEVDAFKDREFKGTVTQIANSSKNAGGGQSQEATKFEVRIRINEKEAFRPGMSITAEIETRYRTNVLSVPMASVTVRPPKAANKDSGGSGDTNSTASAERTNSADSTTNGPVPDRKSKGKDAPKVEEVVFVVEGDQVKSVPVKRGIADDDYWEIVEGLEEGQEVVSGGYRAISRDLQDGKQIVRGKVTEKKEDK